MTYFKKRMEMLNNNYERYFHLTLQELINEYQDANDNIEIEIMRWYNRMNEIKSTNPNFKFSELKQLEELTKQINLILDELAKVESKVVGKNLNELYVSDYLSLARLNDEYQMVNPLGGTLNQFKSASILETYVNMTTLDKVTEIANQLEISWWYSAIQGKWYNTRIEERAKKLGYSIESKLKQAIIRGDSYNKVAGQIMNDLDISFRNAKTLVATELRTAEISAKLDTAKRGGFTHMERRSLRDDHVCKICQEMDGTIYPIDSVRGGDFILHPNDRCYLVEVIVEDGEIVRSQFYNEAQEYIKSKKLDNSLKIKQLREQAKLKG